MESESLNFLGFKRKEFLKTTAGEKMWGYLTGRERIAAAPVVGHLGKKVPFPRRMGREIIRSQK